MEGIPDEDIERICKLWIANVLEEDEEYAWKVYLSEITER